MLLASESRWLGSEWGERGLCRSSCRAGTSCPAKKKRCRHRPQHQMALSPPVPGSDAGLGCSLRCWQPRGGVSHPPAGCSIRGEGCVHGAALHSSFGSVMMLEGGSQDGAGQEKQSRNVVAPGAGEEPASCLHPLPAQVGDAGWASVSARMLVGLHPTKSLLEPRLVSRLVGRPLLDREWVNWGQWEGSSSPVSPVWTLGPFASSKACESKHGWKVRSHPSGHGALPGSG